MRVAFVRTGRDGTRWVGVQVSLVFVGFAHCLPRVFRSLIFVGFVHIFCHCALAVAQTNFSACFYPGALPSFLDYLTMQLSSSHSPHPESEPCEPSTLARMAGLDQNAPLKEEAYAPGND